MESLRVTSLDCSTREQAVLEHLFKGVLAETIEEIRGEKVTPNFPNLYYLCAVKGVSKARISEDKVEIDPTAGSIYVSGSVPLCKVKKLWEYGFRAEYFEKP
ncbi:MAG: hypothetical protein Q7I94_02260 [Candidatus Contubernalis sp.]|nr:hypothetical protein [Candidatus Contubernalis sp.]